MTQYYGEMKQNTMGNRLNGKVTPSHDEDDDDDDNDTDA